jgi:hypothetical protein
MRLSLLLSVEFRSSKGGAAFYRHRVYCTIHRLYCSRLCVRQSTVKSGEIREFEGN